MTKNLRPTDRPTLNYLKFTPLAAALLIIFPVGAQQAPSSAPAASESAPGRNALPDFGTAPRASQVTTVTPGPNGITLQNRSETTRLIVAPEYSNQTGFSLGAGFATLLGEHAAVGLLLSGGADKTEILINAGIKLDQRQRLIVTAGQLKQSLDYSFRSGTEKVGMTQNSGAASYQLQLGQGLLRLFEINGYLANTASRDLADKTFAVESAALYEQWNDPRRIAGGKVTGLQGRLGFTPFQNSNLKISLGTERLSYDLLAGKDSTNRPTGGVEWLQQLGSGYQFKIGAESYASQNRYSLGLERNLNSVEGGRHTLGANFIGLRGRDGIGDDNQFRLTYSYVFGTGGAASAGNSRGAIAANAANPSNLATAGMGGSLLDQVAQRPSFIPSHVVAKIDHTALPTRLIAIDKTALPAGASINTATGDLTVPLGVVVTGLAGVTKNLALFTNGGQFSLAGNSLVIKPSLITQPIAGVVDSYVVTLNNQGGGTTLVTILVSHGSVKIDRITIASGVIADTTAPTTTAAPSVSAITSTGTTLSATINETGTGYYLVQPAAAAAPSVAAVQAGTSFAMTANVAAMPAITGLTAATAYKVYFVAKDAANNVQAAVQNVAVTTTAAALPTGYVSQGGLTWMPNNIMPPNGYANWSAADTYCTTTTINGQTGWRLPTQLELSNLYNSGAMNGQGWVLNPTWSSTPYPHVVGTHYGVYLNNGVIDWFSDANGNSVTCVR